MARRLKPVSDEQWSAIAGAKISERYEIAPGDTLWDISKRLFANSQYWPKVWSLNSRIGNPHIVKPGQFLQFTPATLEAMPSLEVSPDQAGSPRLAETSATQALMAESSLPNEEDEVNLTAQKYLRPKHMGPKDFTKLPADRWAPQDFLSASRRDYDEYGLDRDLKVLIPRHFVARVPAIANDKEISSLGEIVASRREGVGLGERETVFLKSPGQDLQVGSSYSVLSAPEIVREPRSDRLAHVYQTIGEVRIIGIKDGLYLATIIRAYDVIERGAKVYPLLPLITGIQPLASKIAMEALVITSPSNTVKHTAQFRVVHFDRGIEDGVQVGNVFRLYDYNDPATGEKITESDFLMNADALVVHVTAQFSTAIVLRSRDIFTRGDFGVTLTDVSDLEKQFVDRTKSLDNSENSDQIDRELDELDELDRNSGEGLGQKEEIEVKQLEHWDRSKGKTGDAPQETEEPMINPVELEGGAAPSPGENASEPPLEPIEASPTPPSQESEGPDDAKLDQDGL